MSESECLAERCTRSFGSLLENHALFIHTILFREGVLSAVLFLFLLSFHVVLCCYVVCRVAEICFSLQVLQAVLQMYAIPDHLFTEVCVIVDKVSLYSTLTIHTL